jgi:hypothetical protein
MRRLGLSLLFSGVFACSSGDPQADRPPITPFVSDSGEPVVDASADVAIDVASDGTVSVDAPAPIDAGVDSGNGCTMYGASGQCITTTACTALGDHTSYPGRCSGPANVECCIDAPDPTDNPPIPPGWAAVSSQSQVTPEMTSWAVAILNDYTGYPMYSTTMRVFGSQPVLAQVEWHWPDSINNTIHRGVTLFFEAD